MGRHDVLAHWYTLVGGLEHSPKAFFTSLEAAVKEREIPNVDLSRVEHAEGGVLSANREYLRIERKDLYFEICAAPFGRGFFVSSWLFLKPGCLMSLPVLNVILGTLVKPITYYAYDTALMFQSAVHGAVLEVVDELTKTKGLRSLSEADRKPVLRELSRRAG